MLTPGVSQDNIRGFFYRGNVNIGAGTREYSNGFVVDGVNNTWAQMGEPRQNFAMDSIREFKVSQSTYKAEYGLATGGVLTRRHQVGHQPASRLGLQFLPRRGAHREGPCSRRERPDFRRLQYGGTFGGPIVQNRTHFFVAVEGTDENQFFTVNTGGRLAAVRRDVRERAVSLDLHRQGRSPDFVDAEPLRPLCAGGRIPPDHHVRRPRRIRRNSFDFAVPRDSYVVGHTWRAELAIINDFRVQYAYAKYEVSPPYSHGDRGNPVTSATIACDYCTRGLQLPVARARRLRQQPDGTRGPLADSRTTSRWMRELGGTHQWKIGVDLSIISFQGDSLGSPLGSWTFPRDAEYNAERSRRRGRRSTPTRCRPTPRSRSSTSPTYVQDDWQLRRGADAQSRAALRRAVRLVQRRHSAICSAASVTSWDRVRHVPAADSLPRRAPTPRRPQQLRSSRRRRVGCDRRRPHQRPRRLRVVLRQHAHAG